MPTTSHPYYAIVTFGMPTYGTIKTYYRSLDRAIADAKTLGGGSLTNMRIVGCASIKQAKGADISGRLPVVWHG